jgi:ABC-type multidrug transport system fused ATPase/permease subunit
MFSLFFCLHQINNLKLSDSFHCGLCPSQRYGDFLNKNAKEVQNALAQANSVAQEALSCIRTVVAFATEDYEHSKYKGKIVKHYDLNVQQLYAQGFYYMIISTFLINTVVQALLLYVGMVLMERGELNVEVLLAFMLYQSKLQNEVMNLFNSYTSLIKSSGAGDKVFELLDRLIPEPGTGHDGVNAGIDTGPSQLNIHIQQLNFSYPSRLDQQILTNLDIDIPAGKTIALVGKSGCGKSTIIGLLQRFYDPDGGAVIVNDKNLKDINLKSHRQRIGVVTQDPVLFTGSIRDNILYGAKNKTDADVINAAKLANAHVFIEGFPDGYDTQVGERGMQLSGGQRQRVSIARAIISEPNLLLLDEATSALDTESEKLVQDALDHLLNTNNQMTTVVIAHRLQTVRNADNIIVLDKGCVLEQGTHEELLKLNGMYQKMVKRAEDGRFSDE